MNLYNYSIEKLIQTANLLREDVIRMIAEAGSGHPAGSLGMADIFAVLYFKILSYNPQNAPSKERDRLILSNGHICPLLYAALARAGFFSLEELKSLRKLGSPLQGHPSRKDLALIETSSGSLGHGLSVAAGIAYALKTRDSKGTVWVICSDAEHQEGTMWEAAMFGVKYQLGNLKVIVDDNQIQLSGRVSEVMPIEPLREKYQAFGWKVFEADGHNIEELINVLKEMKRARQQPSILLAKTIPGKGVSFMENRWEWHGKALNKEEAERAFAELKNK